MDNRIRKLLQECAVRISVAASRGTGFFAASPGLVVTCAHVVNRRTCWPPLADLCGLQLTDLARRRQGPPRWRTMRRRARRSLCDRRRDGLSLDEVERIVI